MSATAAIIAPRGNADRKPHAIGACLPPLLQSLRWRGSPRQLVEATGFREPRHLGDLRNAMARLGFGSTVTHGRPRDLDTRLLPCIFASPERTLVVLSVLGPSGWLQCFDSAAGAVVEVRDLSRPGTIVHFERVEAGLPQAAQPGRSWLKQLLGRFRTHFALLLGMTFILNLLALAPAIFVQAVYDQILPTKSLETLAYLAAGVGIALFCDVIVRLLRAAALAQLGARLDFLIGSSALQKLLSLPLGQLEKASAGERLAQLRETESLRHAFAGPIVLSLLEIPFVVIFVAAVAFIGGWLAIVPVVFALVLTGLGLGFLRYIRSIGPSVMPRHADHPSLLVEIVTHLPAIKAGGSEQIWRERFRERSAQSAKATLRDVRVAGLTDTIAYSMNIVAGAATLATGTVFALDGRMSVGALIASMAIVWRMLAPIQAIFVTLVRIEQIRRTSRRLDSLMASASESPLDSGAAQTTRGRRFSGRITFDRVYLRYETHHEPALAGISFAVKPGEIVAITGGNGSGKSTVLKLAAALHQPQMGAVLIDGVDTRQLGPQDLRQWITFLPQQTDLFDGTLRDNLRLANPVADDEQLWDALGKVGLLGEVEAMPGGLDTVVEDQLSATFARKLALARTLLIDASIVLLDEPGSIVDEDGFDLLREQFDALRGRATVLIATHQPEHVAIVDRAIVLRNGTIVHDGTPRELMARLTGKRQ